MAVGRPTADTWKQVGDAMDKDANANAVIQKMAVKLANAEVRSAMLEVALETAQAELASLKGTSE